MSSRTRWSYRATLPGTCPPGPGGGEVVAAVLGTCTPRPGGGIGLLCLLHVPPGPGGCEVIAIYSPVPGVGEDIGTVPGTCAPGTGFCEVTPTDTCPPGRGGGTRGL